MGKQPSGSFAEFQRPLAERDQPPFVHSSEMRLQTCPEASRSGRQDSNPRCPAWKPSPLQKTDRMVLGPINWGFFRARKTCLTCLGRISRPHLVHTQITLGSRSVHAFLLSRGGIGTMQTGSPRDALTRADRDANPPERRPPSNRAPRARWEPRGKDGRWRLDGRTIPRPGVIPTSNTPGGPIPPDRNHVYAKDRRRMTRIQHRRPTHCVKATMRTRLHAVTRFGANLNRDMRASWSP
jgi:hypothetical protein